MTNIYKYTYIVYTPCRKYLRIDRVTRQEKSNRVTRQENAR